MALDVRVVSVRVHWLPAQRRGATEHEPPQRSIVAKRSLL